MGDPGQKGDPGPAGEAERFELVGFTATTHLGGEGVLAFTAECQTAFASSRMCSSEEILKTVHVPVLPDAEAWVRPSYRPTGSVDRVVDASGIRFVSPHLSCTGWRSSTFAASGLIVSSTGRFDQDNCSNSRPIACCAVTP